MLRQTTNALKGIAFALAAQNRVQETAQRAGTADLFAQRAGFGTHAPSGNKPDVAALGELPRQVGFQYARRQPAFEYRFNSLLPCRIDVQRLQQTITLVQTLVRQPFSQGRIWLARLVQYVQRFQPSADLAPASACVIEFRPLPVDLGPDPVDFLALQGMVLTRVLEAALGRCEFVTRTAAFLVQPGTRVAIAVSQSGQTLRTLIHTLVQVLDPELEQLHLLPYPRAFALAALVIVVVLGQRIPGLLELFLRLFLFAPRGFQRRLQLCHPAGNVLDLGAIQHKVLLQFVDLTLDLGKLALLPLEQILLMLDRLLQSRNLAGHLIKLRLHRRCLLRRLVLLLAQRFERLLRFSLNRHGLLDPCFGFSQRAGLRIHLGTCVAPAQRVETRLFLAIARLELAITLGGPGLTLKLAQLLGNFFTQIGQALEVLAGMPDTVLGFAPAFLVQ